MVFPLSFFGDRRKKASQSNLYCTQVGDFVNFDLCVILAFVFKNPLDLVCCDGIHAASEGDELDKLYIGIHRRILRRTVESCVVGPLIQHVNVADVCHVVHGILGNHSKAEGRRQLVDTVKVVSADEIIVYLRGSIEIRQNIIK